jgi:hypothetical protein
VAETDELDTAWAAVDAALPWTVNRPMFSDGDRRWHVLAADHRRARKRPDYVEAVGMTEAQALRDLAGLLREWIVEK